MSLAPPDDTRRRHRSKSPGRRSRSDEQPITVERARSSSRVRYENDSRSAYNARPSSYYQAEELKSAPKPASRHEPQVRRPSPAPPRARSPDYAIPGQFPSDESLRSRSGKQRESRRSYYSAEDPKVRSRYTDYNNDIDHQYLVDEVERDRERRAWEEARRLNAEADILREKATRIAMERRGSDERQRPAMRSPRSSYNNTISPDVSATYIARTSGERDGFPDQLRQYNTSSNVPAQDEDGLAYGYLPANYGQQQNQYMGYEYGRSPQSDPRFSTSQLTYPRSSPPSSAPVPYSSSPRSSRDFKPPALRSEEVIATVESKYGRSVSTSGLLPVAQPVADSSRRNSLMVPGIPTSLQSIVNAPPSPVLEAYHGTYQSISPMPSPSMLAAQAEDASLQSLETLNLSSSSTSLPRPRRARFHNIAGDASMIAKALRDQKHPETNSLIVILPGLSHDQVMDLRVEYKKIVKIGSERRGVNVAKHIRLCLKDADPSLMKACYATALGQWESEAYWANFWSQGEKSRRELLIESLMGRTNDEIRAIKDAFLDMRNTNSLKNCMRKELKDDKFKKAILLVLDEIKMEDDSRSGLDRTSIEDDVKALHKCIKSERGGETTMIEIIVLRSERHMREVLQLYDKTHHKNFAREMLGKSGNLVVSNPSFPISLVLI